MCLPFGALCEKIGLPTLFGYVMTGVVLGPSGLNVIKSMVSDRFASMGSLKLVTQMTGVTQWGRWNSSLIKSGPIINSELLN